MIQFQSDFFVPVLREYLGPRPKSGKLFLEPSLEFGIMQFDPQTQTAPLCSHKHQDVQAGINGIITPRAL